MDDFHVKYKPLRQDVRYFAWHSFAAVVFGLALSYFLFLAFFRGEIVFFCFILVLPAYFYYVSLLFCFYKQNIRTPKGWK